jgi:hypothetical protein
MALGINKDLVDTMTTIKAKVDSFIFFHPDIWGRNSGSI